MRIDMQDAGGASPARPSASTLAQSLSCSGQGKVMMAGGGSSTGSNVLAADHMFGDEVEVSSLLVLDQHTFEGPPATTEIICFFSVIK